MANLNNANPFRGLPPPQNYLAVAFFPVRRDFFSDFVSKKQRIENYFTTFSTYFTLVRNKLFFQAKFIHGSGGRFHITKR